MKEDVVFRLEHAEKVGLGFDLPSKTTDVVRIVRKMNLKLQFRTQRTALILKGKGVIEGNRFEPSSAWPCTMRSSDFRVK